MAAIYSEPAYVYASPANAVLTESATRSTQLSPTALSALNYTLDELLHIVVHAALHSPPASTTPTGSPDPSDASAPSERKPPSTPAPLAPDEVLTTDRFKASLARILGPTSLAKECILEAELAVRELIRRGSPSLRGDGALRKGGMWGTPVLQQGEMGGDGEKDGEVKRQAEEVFRALRAWVMQISGVGAVCFGDAPGGLSEHLVAISPPQPAPAEAQSDHISFLLALYVERILASLSTHLLRLVASVSARSSSSDTASLVDLETAFKEDDLVWSWAQGMRVRQFIEDESQRERDRLKSPSLGAGGVTNGTNGLALKKSISPAAAPAPAPGSPPQYSAAGGSTTLGRKPSVAASTTSTTAPTGSSVTRRASIESSRSTATALTYSGSGARKSSVGSGLGIASYSSLDTDSFDALISSGKTIKMSSTPDRLRSVERSRMTSSNSMPSLPVSAVTGSGMIKSSSARRLLARDPHQRDVFNEEDEDTDSVGTGGTRETPRPQKRKESLMDLLNSAPPWQPGMDDPAAATAAAAARRESIISSTPSAAPSRRPSVRPASRAIDPDDPLHPMSVAMRVQDSQNSVTTLGSMKSDASAATATSGEDAYLNSSPGRRMRALKAKDERRDAASERQINTDLMDFFSQSPPPPPAFVDPYAGLPPPLSPKKSKGGLRGLMSKVTGKKEQPEEVLASPSSPASPRLSGPTAGRRSSSRTQSISGASTFSTTSTSIAAMQASGFGNMASKAAYVPPPGLGGSPGPRERRAASISSTVSRSRTSTAERQLQPTPPVPRIAPQGPPPDYVPQSILLNSQKPQNGDATPHPAPPPIPAEPDGASVGIQIPSRSSSLKRRGRERESSAASTTTGSSATTSSRRRAPRDRETSAQSALSNGTTGSRPLPTAETSAPPVVMLANGLVRSDLASKSSNETLGATNSSISHERAQSAESAKADELPPPVAPVSSLQTAVCAPLVLGPPIELKSSAPPSAAPEEPALPPAPPASEPAATAPAEPVQPPSVPDLPSSTIVPLARAGSTTPLHTPPTPPQPARFRTPSPSRSNSRRPSSSPVISRPLSLNSSALAAGSGATPRAHRSSAPSPSSSALALVPSRSRSPTPSSRLGGPRTPLISPPLASPSSGLGASSSDGHSKSLTTVLKELRGAMLYAQTRDECVELVEALLRDQARRREAMAMRESGRAAEAAAQAADGSEEAGREGEEEQARMAEFFLGGSDVAVDEPAPSQLADEPTPTQAVEQLEAEPAAAAPSTGTDEPAPALAPPATLDVDAHTADRPKSLIRTPDMRIPGGFQPDSPVRGREAVETQ
ncbi:hypothetical protein JCM10207_005316 [Rhodosporidiobolus poonsookiae]